MPKARLDDMVRRILRQQFRFGLFERPYSGSPTATVTTPAHAAFARGVAEQGSVLLKNAGGLLPLNPAAVHSIAVLGPGATTPMTSGKGSSAVPPPYVVRPVDAIARRAGSAVTVRTAADATVQAAVQAAAASDVAVVFGDKSAGEGRDFGTLLLPPEQNDMITRVAAVNPRTIVVLDTRRRDDDAVDRPGRGRARGLVRRSGDGQRRRLDPLRGRQPVGQAAGDLPQAR